MLLGNEDYMLISDLGEMLGITTRTIRHYENLGLVDPPKRTEGRIRYYEKCDVERFKFVLKLKALGLSLNEIKELADLYKHERVPAEIIPRLLELLDSHLATIRKRVKTLQSLETDIDIFRKRINGNDEGNAHCGKEKRKKRYKETKYPTHQNQAIEEMLLTPNRPRPLRAMVLTPPRSGCTPAHCRYPNDAAYDLRVIFRRISR
jgi:DNA-binding transcriptional MerR regulator